MSDHLKEEEIAVDEIRKPISRRRAIQLFGMGVTGAAVLAACGDPTTTKASGKVVVYTGKDSSGTVKKLLDAFNAQNNGVTIEYQEGPQDSTQVHDKLVQAFGAKDSSIDIAAIDIAWAAEFGSASFLLPLENYATPDFRKQFFDSSLLGTTYKEKTYAIPWYLNSGLIYYRKDLLDAAGVKPPTTFDELTAAAKQLQTADRYGYIFHGFKNEGLAAMWLEVLWSFGGDFWDTKTGKVLVDSPEAEASLQWLQDSIYTSKISPDKVQTWKYADITNVFNQGNAVFARHWADFSGAAQGAESKVKDKWAARPMVAAAGKTGAGALGPWNLGINASSKNPAGAWAVIQYLSSPEAQKTRTLGTGAPPASKTIYADPALQNLNPAYAVLSDVFNSARPRPVHPAYAQVSSEAIQPNVADVLAKKISPKDAVKKMASTAQGIIAKAGG